MPANYPEMWLNRVERNISDAVNAPWTDGIPEMDTAVVEMGSGTATEANVIHIPTTDFSVDVLVNNTTYPIAVQSYTDAEVIVSLDKFQSKATELSDDQVLGATYNRIDTATAMHTEAIVAKKYTKAAHAMSPSGNTAATPIIVVKGDATEAVGERLRCTYNDLVALKAACDSATPKVPANRRLVLCDDHWNDLLIDRKWFGDQLVNYREGSVAPRILGFDLYRYAECPHYNTATKAKLAFGATATATQFQGSFVFSPENVAKKTGYTKQYFRLAAIDPEGQSNKLNYRHYFIMMPKRVQKIAALISAVKA